MHFVVLSYFDGSLICSAFITIFNYEWMSILRLSKVALGGMLNVLIKYICRLMQTFKNRMVNAVYDFVYKRGRNMSKELFLSICIFTPIWSFLIHYLTSPRNPLNSIDIDKAYAIMRDCFNDKPEAVIKGISYANFEVEGFSPNRFFAVEGKFSQFKIQVYEFSEHWKALKAYKRAKRSLFNELRALFLCPKTHHRTSDSPWYLDYSYRYREYAVSGNNQTTRLLVQGRLLILIEAKTNGKHKDMTLFIQELLGFKNKKNKLHRRYYEQ